MLLFPQGRGVRQPYAAFKADTNIRRAPVHDNGTFSAKIAIHFRESNSTRAASFSGPEMKSNDRK
jgi:hypothetical protein